jgi:divalent metal cation (Fe/Co/Zn/Cd) transporter
VLHEKTLLADAEMNKADWLTGAAAILGVIGIGAGLWWADAAAAAFISVEVLRDGVKEMKRSLFDSCDQRPTELTSDDAAPEIERIRRALVALPFVGDAEVRLHNEGPAIAGDAFIVLSDAADLPARIEAAGRAAKAVSWRVHDITVTVVDRIERVGP